MAAGSGESTTQVVPPSPGRSHPERRRWVVTGQVQGVGFRPFVYHLARSHALTGFVRNDTNGVTIEAEGSRERLDLFALALRRQIPPLSRIDRIRCRRIPCERITHDFRIEVSEDGRTLRADVTPDAALCRDCLRELLDPENPRFGYGLITCTHCGPRYTITRRIPYDRPGTTMSVFDMCPRCRQEYTDPTNRRFHAQPIACLDCGPVMRLLDPQGRVLADDPIKQAATRILAGDIIAIKGLGGFHLAVKADIAGAVRRLRRLKQRDDKPLALMCRSLEATRRLVRLSPQGAAVMQSAACPIVLAPRRTGAPVAEQIAPGSHRLGVMLPYTPIQHLLWRGLPADTIALVMTSANRRGEPLVYRNEDALERLGQMCDAILWHDRPIARGVDDSVVIDIAGEAPLPLRRARGFVPGSCSLPGVDPDSVSAGLCVGGELKNTVAVVQAGRAILSQHVGDLSHPLTHAEFSGALEDLVAMYGVAPRWIAHDLNPIYLSTVRARVLAEEHGIPLLAIQHHHAHAAAVLADNGHTGPVLAIVCDGAGYGPGGEAWGGELLLADLISYRRLARFRGGTPRRGRRDGARWPCWRELTVRTSPGIR
jgi:hydrogenase maturation protein HypF